MNLFKNVFKKVDANGQVLPFEATGHPVVLQENTGLMWSAAPIGNGPVTLDEAERLAAECRLGGFDDWRVAEVEELFVLHDRSRSDPAIDTDYFECPEGSYWSSTPAAWAPREGAWDVYSGNGYSPISYRVSRRWLRVVRSVSGAAGQ